MDARRARGQPGSSRGGARENKFAQSSTGKPALTDLLRNSRTHASIPVYDELPFLKIPPKPIPTDGCPRRYENYTASPADCSPIIGKILSIDEVLAWSDEDPGKM